jgi:hypothetical protein
MKARLIGILLFLGAACASTEPGGGGVMVLPPGAVAGMSAQPTAGTTGQQPATGGASGTSGQVPVNPVNPTGPVAGTDGMTTAGSGGSDGASGGGAPPGNCQGFSFENLVYSPGGEVLPNTCEPFHPTTNNPYAVRCVDAWPWYETQYPGDNFCILPPPPDKGIQYGVHPQGMAWFEQVSQGDMSGYQNPHDDFVMQDGMEEEGNYYTLAGNPQEMNFYRSYPRMRGGSHHMIVSTNDGTATPHTWGLGSPDGLFGGTGLPGAQRPDENTPKSLIKPTEDDGLYSILPAMAGVTFNMHHFNATGMPILKEAWTNLWWEDNATVRVYGISGFDAVEQFTTLSIPPGTSQDIHYSWNLSETMSIRLLTLFGHRHAWTTNLSAWVEKPNGDTEILYQSYDWFDEPTYRYDSMTMNPVPAPQARTDGAASGIRMLGGMPGGEKLHFNCHIENTDERAQALGPRAEPPSQSNRTLRFANQAFTAEMCILFGSTAAVRLPTPVRDNSPLPDFARD